MHDSAPIILFVYIRKWHTEQTINALKNNKLASASDLYIYSDAAKNENDEEQVAAVRNFLKNISGFKSVTIVERKKNLGLADSIISGLNEIFEKFDKAIIMEDDIVSSDNFLVFLNNALDFYNNNEKIFSISGYNFPIEIPKTYKEDVFIFYRSSSWGWATWKNRWDKAVWAGDIYKNFLSDKNLQKNFNKAGTDLSPMLCKQINGKIDSWAIRWAFTHFIHQGYCVFPTKSLVNNIGTDGTGTNFKRRTSKYDVKVSISYSTVKFTNEVKVNNDIEKKILNIVKPGLYTRFKLQLKSFLGKC